MGVVTFTYQIPAKSIGGFEIDCFLNEHISHSNSVTDIPVEDGDNIADHVIENADEIQIQAFIGQAVFEVLEGNLPESSSGEDPKARIKQAYAELLRLKRERQPVDVAMGLATFNNMVIAKFDIDQNAETGANLPFEMAFKSVRIVKSETTTINVSNTGPAGDQVSGTANAGTVGSNQTDPNSNYMKNQWKQAVEVGRVEPDEYQEKWGEVL
jgi:hypothetical protein